MIKKGLLDFLKCLKFFFVPLGILSIFTLMGLVSCVSGISTSIKEFMNGAKEILGNIEFNWSAIKISFVNRVTEVYYTEGLQQGIKTIASKEWLNNTLGDVLKVAFGDTFSMDQVSELIATTITKIVISIVSLFIMFVLGIVVGIFVLKILIRKQMTHVKIGKLILFSILDAFFWLLVILLVVYLSSINRVLNVIVLVIFIVSFGFICLSEGYLFYGIKKIKYRQVMNPINVLKLYAIEILILAITAVIALLCVLIFNKVVGIYIALPFVEIGILSISSTAESYVVHLVEKEKNGEDKKSKKEAKKEIEAQAA